MRNYKITKIFYPILIPYLLYTVFQNNSDNEREQFGKVVNTQNLNNDLYKNV